MENTHIDDDRPVYIERDIQTVESGGVCCETGTQHNEPMSANVYNDENLSETSMTVTVYKTDSFEERSTNIISCNSFTQTLITICGTENGHISACY